MVSALCEGYLVGLSLIILIGPVLFVLLNTTIERGVKSGIAVAMGIFVSDIIAILLCYQGSAHFNPSGLSMRSLSLGGALITLPLGVRYLTRPPELGGERNREEPVSGLWRPFIRGFAVNFINPFVFIVWLGIISVAQERFPAPQEHIAYLSATLIGILSLDLSKAIFAHRLISWLKPHRLKSLIKASGVVLILFGFRLMFNIF